MGELSQSVLLPVWFMVREAGRITARIVRLRKRFGRIKLVLRLYGCGDAGCVWVAEILVES
jgi:hypothetical protein